MAKKFNIADESLLSIKEAPPIEFFMDLLFNGKSNDYDLVVQFPDGTICTMDVKICGVKLDKKLEGAYFFTAVSEQVSSEFSCFYDLINLEGWMSKKFDNRLN